VNRDLRLNAFTSRSEWSLGKFGRIRVIRNKLLHGFSQKYEIKPALFSRIKVVDTDVSREALLRHRSAKYRYHLVGLQPIWVSTLTSCAAIITGSGPAVNNFERLRQALIDLIVYLDLFALLPLLHTLLHS
jgi:hypothetical protein